MADKFPLDKRINKELWDRTFRSRANLPESWYLQSLELLKSGDLIWDESERLFELNRTKRVGELFPIPVSKSIAMMLYGLAIENSLKALAISQSGGLDEAGKFMHKTHKLVEIAEETKSPINDEVKFMLEKFQQFVEWRGRYPIPLDSNNLRPVKLPDGRTEYLTTIRSSDRKEARAYVESIRGILGIKVISEDMS